MRATPLPLIACVGIASSIVAGQGCSPEQLDRAPGLSERWVAAGGAERPFLLYVPRGYSLLAPSQLWILAPGSYNEPERQVEMSEMVLYAEEQQFPFVAIRGGQNLLNVVRGSQPDPQRPDDVAYTRAVLSDVRRRLCIDEARVYCAGYSRGARFCSRLASELSGSIAAIAAIAGVRFPRPNNATRPVPVVAFHGTGDPVNPYAGHGNREYWYDSVPEAIQQWADFNQCRRGVAHQLSPHVAFEKHTDCLHGADVVLVTVDNGGHTWPGSRFDFGDLGATTQEVNASAIMGAFFSQHRGPAQDTLQRAVKWILNL